MIVVSFVLVIVAAVTLVIGLFQTDTGLEWIWASIGSCIAAMVFLGIGVLQRRAARPQVAGDEFYDPDPASGFSRSPEAGVTAAPGGTVGVSSASAAGGMSRAMDDPASVTTPSDETSEGLTVFAAPTTRETSEDFAEVEPTPDFFAGRLAPQSARGSLAEEAAARSEPEFLAEARSEPEFLAEARSEPEFLAEEAAAQSEPEFLAEEAAARSEPEFLEDEPAVVPKRTAKAPVRTGLNRTGAEAAAEARTEERRTSTRPSGASVGDVSSRAPGEPAPSTRSRSGTKKTAARAGERTGAKKTAAKAAKKATSRKSAVTSAAGRGPARAATAKDARDTTGVASTRTDPALAAKGSRRAARQTTREAARAELAKIKGLGPAKQEALLREFGSIEAIRAATIEQLTSIRGIGETTAREILAQARR